MWFFIARRVLYAVPILFGVSFVVFLLMKLVPGDAADVLIPPEAGKDVADMIRARFGLDPGERGRAVGGQERGAFAGFDPFDFMRDNRLLKQRPRDMPPRSE